MKRPKIRRRPLILKLIIIVSAVVLFYAGYQLALYQETNDDELLPHFTIGLNTNIKVGCTYADCCTARLYCGIMDKPVIYLYPTHTEFVNVRLSYVSGFSKTIPVYDQSSGWNVLAHPDGALINGADHKNYPYLFWEGNPTRLDYDMHSGFVISGSDSQAFLASELPKLGLDTPETQAFMAYWVPKLALDRYNLIHFAGEQYTKLAPLTITPKPDALLRVNMAYKALQRPVAVTTQTFPRFRRHGFSVVEWGGTKLY